jgi:hypothetical protein
MTGDEITQVAIIFGGAGLCLVACLGMAWRAERRARPKPVVPIFDEGASMPELAAWSPTRGFYYFRAVDLPACYLKLSGVNDGATFEQFGEDEADARIALWNRLRRRWVAENMRGVAEALGPDVKSNRFKPLTKRKKDRTP